MTPAEMVAVIEDADAHERRGARRIILELTAPSLTILGQRFDGKYLGNDVGGAVYGYTRRQALAIRDAIYAAARDDARADRGQKIDDRFGDGAP